jgi:glycine dehydrogenase
MDFEPSPLAELAELEAADGFATRHIGPSESDIAAMLRVVGAATLEELAAKTVPPDIRMHVKLDLPPPLDEARRSPNCAVWPSATCARSR